MEGGPSIQDRDDDDLLTSSSARDPERNSGCCYSLCHPRGGAHRFIALIFMCLLGFGSYFCYDNPSALQHHFESDLNITSTQYGMLNSMYSWPNVVLCFVGGFLIDRVFGIRLGTNIYMGLTLIGQIIFATAAYANLYWLMLVGRFVFGIGAESLAVAQNNYAVLWFKGKELNMVFGLQLSFARVGSAVNFIVMDSVYEWVNKSYQGPQGLGLVLMLSGTTCIFSMVCALILGVMDKRAERILRRSESASTEVVKLTDVKDFKGTFWLVAVICVTYYVAIFPFIAYGQEFFMTKYHMSKQQANNVDSIVYFIAGVASPILGLMVDKLGKNILWITTSVAFTIGAHCLLAFGSFNPYVGMVIMGIAYSCLASSLWPLVALIIPEYQLGTAYGVCQAVQNLGLAISSIIAGVIKDNYGYFWLENFFIINLAIAFLTAVIFWIIDYKQDGILNMTAWARNERQLSEEDGAKDQLLANEEETSNDANLPNSDFQIRNRYLSRIGAPVSDDNED